MTTLRLDPITSLAGGKQLLYQGPVWYKDPEKQDLDTDVEKVVLDIVNNTKKLRDLDVTEIITDGYVESTMDGASTVVFTLHDPDREILKSGALRRAIDVQLNGLWFRLVRIEKSGSFITLTFEDRIVAYIKTHNKILKMSRGKMTRLEFCLYMIRQIDKKIQCVIPELSTKPRYEQLSRQDKSNLELSKDVNKSQGLPNQKFEIYHADGSLSKSTKRQNKMMDDALDAGVSKDGMVQKVLVSAICVMMIETGVQNLSQEQSDSDSQGPFQQRPSQDWPNSRDTKVQARAYYDAAMDVYKDDHSLTAGEIAANVQRPRRDLRDRYGKAEFYAQIVVDAYSGEPVTQRTYRKKYTFSTEDNGKKQNYWDALDALLSPLQYARFTSNGFLYLISEPELFKSKAKMIIDETTEGVTSIDFTWDVGQEDATATVECRIARWLAPAGSVVVLHDVDPASGRWLVRNIRRNLFSRDATITLGKPQPLLPEPASEVASVDVDETTAAGFSPGLGLPGKVAAMYRQAKRISDKHYPYVWGGGHARAGIPDRGTGRDPGIGYDCSGSVAAILIAGGWYRKGQSVPVSNELPAAAGMVGGNGKYFTVWANANHVFAEFYKDGKHDLQHTIHYGTGNFGKGWGGPGINTTLHPKEGFAPYHFEDEGSVKKTKRKGNPPTGPTGATRPNDNNLPSYLKPTPEESGTNSGRDVKNAPAQEEVEKGGKDRSRAN
jgi:hypothetical protein